MTLNNENLEKLYHKTCSFVNHSKIRKKNSNKKHKYTFPKLLRGIEPDNLRNLRYDLYLSQWNRYDSVINKTISTANESIINAVSKYIESAPLNHSDKKEHYEEKTHNIYNTVSIGSQLYVALVLLGADVSTHLSFFEQLYLNFKAQKNICVNITMQEAPNLKAALRFIVAKMFSEIDSFDLDFKDDSKFEKRSGYDIDVFVSYLSEWRKQNKKIVIIIEDADAFEFTILIDLFKLFHAYLDRLPFTLVLGITIPLEIFCDRIPNSMLEILHNRLFDLTQSDKLLTEIIRKTLITSEVKPLINPILMNELVLLSEYKVPDPLNYVKILKMTFMSYFYSNPLSIFMGKDVSLKDLPKEYILLISGLDSFNEISDRVFTTDENKGETKSLELKSKKLCTIFDKLLNSTKTYFEQIAVGLDLFVFLRNELNCKPRDELELYLKAVTGLLPEDESMTELVIKLSECQIKRMLEIIELLIQKYKDLSFISTISEIKKILNNNDSINQGTKSFKFERSRKSEYARPRNNISKEEKKKINEFISILEKYFLEIFIAFESKPIWEIFKSCSSGLYKKGFSPQYRRVLEGNLLGSSKYLLDEFHEISFPLIEFFKRSRESIPDMNVEDLWKIYKMKAKELEFKNETNIEIKEEEYFAWFLLGLAESRFIGFIKPGNKRAYESVRRQIWCGL